MKPRVGSLKRPTLVFDKPLTMKLINLELDGPKGENTQNTKLRNEIWSIASNLQK